MTANDFRRIALGLNEAIEASHMGHPDFRVNGRIFATLHDDNEHGMVKLPPDEQERLVREHPEMFRPENGAWGRQGCTRVHLLPADEDAVGEAMTLAWQDALKEEGGWPIENASSGQVAPAALRRPPQLSLLHAVFDLLELRLHLLERGAIDRHG
jgi:hypothetical protein